MYEDIIRILLDMYPSAKCELNYKSVFELLIAVMLSAQCTDKRVNIVTDKLFKEYKTPESFLKLGEEDLCSYIKSCGLYSSKAKNILKTCEILVYKYGGVVPNTMEDLIELPGVGRKTASVVLAVGFNVPALPVDTHVFRVSNRIGLVKANNVLATEEQLKSLYEPDKWILLHHLLIFHGRYTCTAKNPKCDVCKIKKYCEKYELNY